MPALIENQMQQLLKETSCANRHLPGLSCYVCNQADSYVYQTVFFGAKREWNNDDEGWEPARVGRNRPWKGKLTR